LLAADLTDIQILKTELSLEPIRADAVIFLQIANRILHLEFQTLPASKPPLPLRMLDYWVRLHRQYECDIEQVVLFLTPTTAEAAFINQFIAPNTSHRYRVIRIWEQDPEPLLASPALLPLATLARTDTAETLLARVADQVDKITELEEQRNVSACVQLLAGLKFDNALIHRFFKEEVMQESVVYQEIIKRGVQQGLEQGKTAELALISRQLSRRIGSVNSQLQTQLQALSFAQLEDLGEALLDFSTEADLGNWLNQQSS
jgi:predicted transposase/invertase (TIGR01784 family)